MVIPDNLGGNVEIELPTKKIESLMNEIENLKENKRLDDAVAIMKNELLPLMHKTGEKTHLAMAYTVLADLYQESGKTDEAIQILKEQVLPRFLEEKNDFLSELASTMIANLLPDQNPNS
jgi:hypothetical protein